MVCKYLELVDVPEDEPGDEYVVVQKDGSEMLIPTKLILKGK